MNNPDKYYNHEVMTDYFKDQHRIATDLILGLTCENDRKIASKWLQFLYEKEPTKEEISFKLLIIQGLILMLNANLLVSPLNEAPSNEINFKKLSETDFALKVNSELNKNRPQLPPKVKYEVSEDRREYVAYQKIPNYGAHFCYVYSGSERDPIVRTEEESGTVVLDDTIQFERNFHPLIQKYIKEIQEFVPKSKSNSFQYNDLTESFGGMQIPEKDPNDDVLKEYELVSSQGEIGHHESKIASDLDDSLDRYDQFQEDPLHHDRPRVSLKQTIIEKAHEERARLEHRHKNKSMTPIPIQDSFETSTDIDEIPESDELIPTSSKNMDLNNNENEPQDLILLLSELENEMEKLQDSDESLSRVESNIRDSMDKVWKNPLMQNLSTMHDRNVSLPLPPKIDFGPLHHDRPRLSLQQTIIEKAHEKRARLEQQPKNKSMTPIPIQNSFETSTDIDEIPESDELIPTSSKNMDLNNNENERQMEEIQDSDESLSRVESNIRYSMDKVWKNPLMQNLSTIRDRNVSLPLPPKIHFDENFKKHQSF